MGLSELAGQVIHTRTNSCKPSLQLILQIGMQDYSAKILQDRTTSGEGAWKLCLQLGHGRIEWRFVLKSSKQHVRHIYILDRLQYVGTMFTAKVLWDTHKPDVCRNLSIVRGDEHLYTVDQHLTLGRM